MLGFTSAQQYLILHAAQVAGGLLISALEFRRYLYAAWPPLNLILRTLFRSLFYTANKNHNATRNGNIFAEVTKNRKNFSWNTVEELDYNIAQTLFRKLYQFTNKNKRVLNRYPINTYHELWIRRFTCFGKTHNILSVLF